MRVIKNAKMRLDINVRQQAEGKKVGELYLYDDIKSDDYDFWSGEKVESDTSGKAICKKLDEMGEVDELNIYISSNGGSVKEGLAIYSQLSRMDCIKTAYIDGIAASIATVITCACDKIVMNAASLFMIHNAWSYAVGNANELRKAADDLDVITQASKNAYLKKSGGNITAEKLTELMDGESWLTADQCVEYGFCDEVSGEAVNVSDAPAEYKAAATLNAEMRAAKDTDIADRYKNAVMGEISARLAALEKGVEELRAACRDNNAPAEDAPTAPEQSAENAADESGKAKAEQSKRAMIAGMSALFDAFARK